ncbi:MAG: class I SAM-dependent methyltransferase [Candidatus Lindowbacteria bacterium]|nr:class I SAM-dependent methyltransferase [Candidatus Lindowbacteria bacterium]
MGCGAGPNLLWLAQKGISVSGVDVSPTALNLCRENFENAGLTHKIDELVEASVVSTPFEDESFDGICESCVFQHLGKEDRLKTFAEVKRLLKPGGIFAAYMLDAGHSTYQLSKGEEDKTEPGTLNLNDGLSNIYLTNIGVAHFYVKEEIESLLEGFSVVDPCLVTYFLPRSEAKKRGYEEYRQSMWAVYAVK